MTEENENKVVVKPKKAPQLRPIKARVTENQVEQLMTWLNSEKRVISLNKLANEMREKVGKFGKATLFKLKNEEMTYWDLSLKQSNAFIEIYNEDLEQMRIVKQEEEIKNAMAKETQAKIAKLAKLRGE